MLCSTLRVDPGPRNAPLLAFPAELLPYTVENNNFALTRPKEKAPPLPLAELP
jgi:hypothetical protein